jgi:hypothetical protein
VSPHESVGCTGQTHEKFFRQYLLLPNGILSHGTLNRFFSNLDPKVLEQAFALMLS